jgi:hypothetical protein
MAYATLYANCYECGFPFASNPSLVPSLRLENGEQVVFCRRCVELANPIRIKNGLKPIPILPETYEAEQTNPYEAMVDFGQER